MLVCFIVMLDYILCGWFIINIIFFNMLGEELEFVVCYQCLWEVIEILKQCWMQDYIDFKGEFYNIQLLIIELVKFYQ